MAALHSFTNMCNFLIFHLILITLFNGNFYGHPHLTLVPPLMVHLLRNAILEKDTLLKIFKGTPDNFP